MSNQNMLPMKDNKDMEVRLIGKLLNNPKDYYDYHSQLSESIFKDPLNKKIYKVISSYLDKGDKVDMITISSSIKDSFVDVRVAECMSSDYYAYITGNMVAYLSQEDKKIRLKKLTETMTNRIDRGDDLFDMLDFMEAD